MRSLHLVKECISIWGWEDQGTYDILNRHLRKVFRRRATNQWKWRVRSRQVVTVILRRNQLDPIHTRDSATEHCGLIAGERSPDWLIRSAKIPRAFSYVCYSLQLPLSGLRFFRLPLQWHTLRKLIIILLWTANRQRGRSQFTFFPLSLLLSLTISDKYLKDVFQEYFKDTQDPF